MKITKKSSFQEVIEKHPETIDVFMKHGMHCVGCMAASFETIEDGASAHGMDVNKLITELNKVVKKK